MASLLRPLPVMPGQPAAGEFRQLLVHHHPSPHVVGPQFRHLQTVAVVPLRPLHPVAVAAQQLNVPPFIVPAVGPRHDVVRLEAHIVGLIEPQPGQMPRCTA